MSAAKSPERSVRWRKRLIRVALVLLVLRGILALSLPSLLGGVAEGQGFEARWEDLDLSLLGADIELRHLELHPLESDAEAPWLHIEYLRADVELLALFTGDLLVRRVEVDGLDVELQRDAQGVLGPRGATLAAATEADPDEEDEAEPADPDEDTELPERGPSLAPPLALDSLRLQHVRVSLRDETRSPPVEHRLELNLRLSDLGAENRPTLLSLDLSSPTLLDTLRIEGSAQLSADVAEARLRFDLRGLDYTPWTPELAAAGWRPASKTAGLGLDFDVELSAQSGADGLALQARVLDVGMGSAPEPAALTLERLSVELAQALDGSLRVSEALVSGVGVRVQQLPGGGLGLLGLHSMTAPPSEPTPEPEAPSAPSAEPPRVFADTLRVEAVALELTRSGRPPLEVFLDALQITDLDTQLAPDGEPATISGGLRLPGLIEAIDLGESALSLRGESAQLDLRLRGTDLRPERLDVELAAAGVSPKLRSTGFDAQFRATVGPEGLDAAEGIVQLAPLEWEQRGRAVSLPLRVVFGASEVRAPVADGGWPSVAGARLELSVDGLLEQLLVESQLGADGDVDQLETNVYLNGLDLSGAWPWLPEHSELLGLNDVMARLNLDLRHAQQIDAPLDLSLGGALHLTSLSPPRATWTLDLEAFPLAESEPPARLELLVKVPGDIKQLSVRGELWPLGAPRAELQLAAEGMTLQRIAAMLPPGVAVDMQSGRFGASLAASVQPSADGGQQLDVALTDLDYRDAGAAEPYLALDTLALHAPRLDAAGGVTQIDQVALLGLRGHAWETDTGEWRAAGLRLGAPPPARESGTETQPIPSPTDKAAASTKEEASNAATSAPEPAPSVPPPAQESAPMQRLALRELVLELSEFVVHPAAGEAIRLADLRLRSTEALDQSFTDDAEDDAALTWPLELSGSLQPIDVRLAGALALQPFAEEPGVTLDLALDHLSGERLLAWRPELAEQVDPSGLEEGGFGLHLEARLEGGGGEPFDFALSEGRTLDVRLSDIAWRSRPEGEVLAGVDGVHLRLPGGQAKAAQRRVELIQIDTPRLRAEKRADGLHVLGLRLPPPPEAAATDAASEGDELTDAEASADDTEASGADTDSVALTDDPASAGGLLVEELQLSGLDVLFIDHSSEPPFHLPLDRLDVDVRNLGLGAGADPSKLRASVLLGSGKVPDPDDPSAGQHVLLEDLELHLTGTPLGRRLQLSLVGLDLGTLEGAVSGAGVELEGGQLDVALDARMPAEGDLSLSTRARFLDLDLSESEGGPISRYLKLPAPLDAVLFALRDENGAIEIPIDLEIPQDGLSGGTIAGLAISTLGGLIGDALASAPLRVVGGVGSLVGLDLSDTPVDIAPERLRFLPGALVLSPVDAARLPTLLDALREQSALVLSLEHRPGAEDLASLGERWPPSEALCRQLLDGLAHEHEALLRAREGRLAVARAGLVAGPEGPGRAALQSLRALDIELGELQARMKDLIGLLGRARERGAQRSLADGLVLLAEERLARIRAELLRLAPELADRVRVRRPQRGAEAQPGAAVLGASYRHEVGL